MQTSNNQRTTLVLYNNKRYCFMFECYVLTMMMINVIFYIIVIVLSIIVSKPDVVNGEPLIEPDRLKEYYKRNYTWPVRDYTPNTTGWRTLMEKRFKQISEMDHTDNTRYEGYYQIVNSAIVAPNFTQYGFGLTKCPEYLLKEMQDTVRNGLSSASYEARDDVIDGPDGPLMVYNSTLTKRVLNELLPYVEEWVHMPLQPYQAYGFRLYQNQSALYMHVDRLQTHVISYILHIDSENLLEDWPIYIEDFLGNTHEVILKPGDILFYESSKCFHGRPKRLNGTWYTSLFAHYYPKYDWSNINRGLDVHYAVPPHWNAPHIGERTYEKIQMIETSMKEPDCPNEWCNTLNTIKWGGPAKDGILITPTMEHIPFHPKRGKYDNFYNNEEL